MSAEQPGPLGEEAAKLLDALSGWARNNLGGSLGGGFGMRDGNDLESDDQSSGQDRGGVRGHLHDAFTGLGEAIADGSPACRVCPVCQVIVVLRQAKPETFAHLLEASAALTAALRSMVEQADGSGDRRAAGVQRIDLDPPAASRGQAAPA